MPTLHRYLTNNRGFELGTTFKITNRIIATHSRSSGPVAVAVHFAVGVDVAVVVDAAVAVAVAVAVAW